MHTALRAVARIVCVIATAAGVVATSGASSVLAAMLYVLDTEGALQPPDQRLLRGALLWLLIALPATAATWYLYRRTLADPDGDKSLKLVTSRGSRGQKIVERLATAGAILIFVVKLCGRARGDGFSGAGEVIACIIVGFLGLHLRILLHELSHLGAAKALRFNLHKMQVGVGRVLFCYASKSRFRAEWRLWPAGGFVSATPEGKAQLRLRYFLFIAAGPIADVVLLCAALWLVRAHYGSFVNAFAAGTGGVLLLALFWCTAASTLAGLIPQTVTIGGLSVRSDGDLMRWLCTNRRSQLGMFLVGYDASEALKLLGLNRRSTAGSAAAPSPIASLELSSTDAPAIEFHGLQRRLASPLLPRSHA